ncbi:formate--tetrahydrofolate ligase [Psychroflexus torquis ATCC 700755]|uniref:Formate--tetrahydrofolate ligase n=1 Tax=Psychroflexus torquis (strain ATCC 700755 / CIP 106069 / ACAM 623) TaxID=313595 RepID=K4IVF5_PSYTT|nr:formate--tetrahydrofolate ligase [Psychroflexus torquis]AFU69450.1 formate--tetrahydrofolate ligase [Psychroflexus torquis ATCC 700755]
MTDIEIAQKVKADHIKRIAEKLDIKEAYLEYYGNEKAKLPLDLIDKEKVDQSNLILVTAITPTPAGEGKTTTSIGLSDGLNCIGKKSVVVLREPSLGPVFGMKGGATGGGWSQVIPMVDINLHFTGDFHAIAMANNLLAALIDNNIQNRSKNLGIDPRTVIWKRCMDMNDRSLRNIVSSLGGKAGGIPSETGFNITAASEIMAILCLCKNLENLQEMCSNIYIGDTFEGKAVYAKDLNASGAMAVLLKDAIKPNLVQTLEGNPAIIHGGPFANIAQGTNSIIATKMGMSLGDYVVTEAGFAADLGAEKFLNIKCRKANLSPKAVVIVATIRALKYHGGLPLDRLTEENLEALEKGIPNLERHIESIQSFGLPIVVSINAFNGDTEAEKNLIYVYCKKIGVPVVLSYGWAEGGKGCIELAEKVVAAAQTCKAKFTPTYDLKDSSLTKIEKICRRIYGANNVVLTAKAKKQLNKFEGLGYGNLPICMAKTQKSLSDNEKLLGRPRNFDIHIREFEIAAGAGFIIPIAGNILRMPGLPLTPSSEKIKIDRKGTISGLF